MIRERSWEASVTSATTQLGRTKTPAGKADGVRRHGGRHVRGGNHRSVERSSPG